MNLKDLTRIMLKAADAFYEPALRLSAQLSEAIPDSTMMVKPSEDFRENGRELQLLIYELSASKGVDALLLPGGCWQFDKPLVIPKGVKLLGGYQENLNQINIPAEPTLLIGAKDESLLAIEGEIWGCCLFTGNVWSEGKGDLGVDLKKDSSLIRGNLVFVGT